MNSSSYISELIDEISPKDADLLRLQLERLVLIAQKEGYEQAFEAVVK
jgi:hypothetical protein